jgi:hypothetical protein
VRRFLVVGCGGSGGATLQFMMDQLKASLVSRGITTWPIEGWQFVHVDVPPTGDGVSFGVPTVAKQGGSYIRTSYNHAAYAAVIAAVEAELGDRDTPDLLGSWALRAQDVYTPVTNGAGQIRAVGRALALSRIHDIQSGLSAAWERLQSPEARYSLEAVADVLSVATKGQISGGPVVLVVSSMAGGAGASMALDVCRLLSLIPGMTPDIGLYACTAEVFYELAPGLRTGVEGNALAMIGEVVAAQSGAAAAGDNRLLRALGVAAAGGKAPFRRVFPIGSKVGGDGANFGDGTMAGVYRGLGRGLAALMLSGIATNDLVAYRLGTAAEPHIIKSSFGWGIPSEQLVWGSFGFASLAMGRDRYAEYSAQRIARRAVDHLADGHKQPGDTRDVSTQVQDAADTRWNDFAQRTMLPIDASGNPNIWLQATLEPANLQQQALHIASDVFGAILHPGPTEAVGPWVQGYVDRLPQGAAKASERTADFAYRWAFGWYEAFTARVMDATIEAATISGLPTTRVVLGRLASVCGELSTNLRLLANNITPPNIAAPELTVHKQLSKLNNSVAGFSQPIAQVNKHHEGLIRLDIVGRIAHLLADVLGYAESGLIDPLRKALTDQLATLEAARKEIAQPSGIALLKTAQYAMWPTGSEANVPKRFAEAHNDVLMTSSESFEADFKHHIVASTGSSAHSSGTSPDLATQRVAMSVISGHIESLAAANQQLLRLEELIRWRPAALGRTPDARDAATVPQRLAMFAAHFNSDALVEGARAYVARPLEVFDTFVSESLRQYVLAVDEPEHIRGEREQMLAKKFDQTLLMARPLVSIDPEALQRLHGEKEVRFEYAFSTIPFAGTVVEDRLRVAIKQNNTLLSTVPGAFDAALSVLEASSIDVFGFYPNYSPLVFRSLYSTIAQTYAALPKDARKGFWSGRRARPLPGALPMSVAMREALVGGYYLARQLDLVRLPKESASGGVEFRSKEGAWEPLRVPLLTPVVAPEDVLTTLLESYTLASALWASHHDDTLLPYRLLRSYYDNGVDPTPQGQPLTAGKLLDEYVNNGTSFGVAVAKGADLAPETRRANLVSEFRAVARGIDELYVEHGPAHATETVVSRPLIQPRSNRRTMIAEIAPDIVLMTRHLSELAAAVGIFSGLVEVGTERFH